MLDATVMGHSHWTCRILERSHRDEVICNLFSGVSYNPNMAIPGPGHRVMHPEVATVSCRIWKSRARERIWTNPD